jgi:hypothetical protein
MRWTLRLILVVAGCAPTSAADPPPAYAEQFYNGTCRVRQIMSAHLAEMQGARMAASEIAAVVRKDGSVGLSIVADAYPGTRASFSLGGAVYGGPADQPVLVPIEPLLAEQVVTYSYVAWPSGSERVREDVIVGFAAAYEQCK